ncbi:cytochrome c oxidase assembly protein COX15 homolog [Paramacrobiotus metropolitanus]|uniref:cytochrome c oxidase assembly protein COX15 homolog n=1 Tax=Paramacrobiotus metropolitanus TaxID=2943436 RepID=UPI002445F69C|nr:cytochrome c oxidase assembly protein COX15 homolog [Paramacrobiotus metropolitanus]
MPASTMLTSMQRSLLRLPRLRSVLQPITPIRSTVSDAALLSQKLPHGLVVSRDKVLGYWLLGCSGMVVGAVVLGGVTRLTESGLSITEWQPIRGVRPPLSQAEWVREFEKYQDSPEFKYKNQYISLNEFKWIWYMEYAHRLWGRAIGVAIAVPAAYFLIRGWLSPAMKKKVLAFTALLGFQGFLGWYMVKSGLEEKKNQYEIPRVSQYRLCAHLGSALVLFAGLFWEGLSLTLRPQRQPVGFLRDLRTIRHFAHGTVGLIFLTALSGAFVAGLDAGLVYNSWPKMADRWIPSDVLAMKPAWRNFFENHSTTQFQHRLLGYLTTASVAGLWLYSRKKLPHRAQLAANLLLLMVGVQVSLGIATLLTYVPTPLAASHQSGSLALLSLGLWLMHELRRIPKI